MRRAMVSWIVFAAASLIIAPTGAAQVEQEVVAARESSRPVSPLSLEANLVVRDVPMVVALKKLSQTSGAALAFSPSHVAKHGRSVTCECPDSTVGETLDRILAGSGFRYEVLLDQILVYLAGTADTPRIESEPSLLAQQAGPINVASTLSAPSARLVSPAQPVGVITGSVTDQAGGNAISSAQIYIEDLDMGVLTQANGRYLLQEVPPGTHTVSVERIGYRTVTREVSVPPGETVVEDFALSQQALNLDEIVVTGTPAGARIRELGNAVSQVDAQIAETQPISNVSDLLQGRATGVVIQQGRGAPGTASTIKIRGSSTMRLVNDGPLIYIDGVRVNNRVSSSGSDVSRLDDLDPSNIESIEVIKGPAAATLYGTEAANGVLQIITKRGVPGETQWNVTTRQGAAWFRDPAGRTPTNWGVNPTTGEIEGLNLMANKAERDRMFRYGRTQYYGLDLSGGTSGLQYYVSGSADLQDGVTRNSWANKYNGRLNLTASPTENLTVDASAGIALTRLRLPDDYPYQAAVYGNPRFLDSPLRGFRDAPPEVWPEKEEFLHEANRMNVGLTANHTPWDWFNQRLTFGIDVTDQVDITLENHLRPEYAQFFSPREAAGSKEVEREGVTYTTLDYAASGTASLSESIASTTSLGFQLYTKTIDLTTAEGEGFPALGLETVGATGTRIGSDDFIENNTVGVYLQEQIGWRDRVFVTGAVRADDNSAFGEQFDLVYYPKVSGSWVLSDEDFWGLDFINSFRLRAAYGQSGQQPDAFDALRSFIPRSAPDGSATVTPDTPGNEELGPERGVEIEAGFDAGFFNDRVTLDVTYYDQTTKDAIVARNVAPSAGFTEERFVNIGRISNRGVEIGLDARALESQSLDWDVGLSISTNRNRIEELGLDGFLELGWTTRHQEGYPVGSLFAPDVIEATLDPDGRVREFACDNGQGQPVECNEDAWIYQGHPDPNLEGSFTTTLTFSDRLQLQALVQGKIGQTKYDLQGWWLWAAYQSTHLNLFPEQYDPTDVAEAQYGNTGEFDLWVNEASFVRLREVSLGYSLPGEWTQRVGADRGRLTVAGRNLGMLWTNWPTWPTHDPEVVDPTNTFSGNREPQEDATVPPLTSFTVSLRLTF